MQKFVEETKEVESSMSIALRQENILYRIRSFLANPYIFRRVCKSFQSVFLREITLKLNDNSTQFLPEFSYPNLEKFNLIDTRRRFDSTMVKQMDSGNLRHIIMSNWKETLKYVSMKINFLMNEAFDVFFCLADLEILEVLKLDLTGLFNESSLIDDEDDGNRMISKILGANECNLQELDLKINHFEFFDFSESVQMTNLKKVTISYTDNVLKFLDLSCPNLEYLQMSFCPYDEEEAEAFHGFNFYLIEKETHYMRNILFKLTTFKATCYNDDEQDFTMLDFLAIVFQQELNLPNLTVLNIYSGISITNEHTFVQNLYRQVIPKLDLLRIYPLFKGISSNSKNSGLFCNILNTVTALIIPSLNLDLKSLENTQKLECIDFSIREAKQAIEAFNFFFRMNNIRVVNINLNFSSWSEINILSNEFKIALEKLNKKNESCSSQKLQIQLNLSHHMAESYDECCDDLKLIFNFFK